MFTLKHALADHDLATLRVIGEWYELDLAAVDKNEAVNLLDGALRKLDMSEEIRYVPVEESEALLDLAQAGGRMTVAAFERSHGQIRQMGPGRMEREEPWLDPISPAEALWYRGFIYRAFEEADEMELEEYYYLAVEMYEQLAVVGNLGTADEANDSISPSPYPSPDHYESSSIEAVDDLTTLLASAQKDGLTEDQLSDLAPFMLVSDLHRMSLLYTLAWEIALLRATDAGSKPTRKVVDWLKDNREVQLFNLMNAWRSSSWNELHHTPGIVCEGSGWENEARLAREALIDAMPADSNWYLLKDVVAYVKNNDPDFQRPGGKYNTWYIRDERSGEYLAGFESWDHVEARQLSFIVRGPMAWLGMVELARAGSDQDQLYRLTRRALAWKAGEPVDAESIEVPIVVKDDASILVPVNAGLYKRFQIARVAEAEVPLPNMPYRYILTPTSLKQAQAQGIDASRLLRFLEESSGRPIPASTRRAIERWEEKGIEGRLEQVIVLRVRDAEILEKLRANPKTRIYLAEALGELAVAVRPEEWSLLRQAAAQLGLLLDYKDS